MFYSSDEIKQIKGTYITAKGNLSEAQRQIQDRFHYRVPIHLIKKYWGIDGNKPNSPGKLSYDKVLTDAQKDLICKRLPMYETPARIARALGHSVEVVKKILIEKGLIQDNSGGLEKKTKE